MLLRSNQDWLLGEFTNFIIPGYFVDYSMDISDLTQKWEKKNNLNCEWQRFKFLPTAMFLKVMMNL